MPEPGDSADRAGDSCRHDHLDAEQAELFGAAAGAYTGANADRAGLFLQADGGTLLLDELGEMPLATQPKLLRVLEDRRVRAVGSDTSRRVDVRVLAATNQDMSELVDRRRFRADLYHRIRGVTLSVPPLRARREDIVLIAQHHLSRQTGRDPETQIAMTSDFAEALLIYDWPGNVRELLQVIGEAIHLATVSGDDLLTESHLRAELLDSDRDPEKSSLREALQRSEGNVSDAAEALGISRGQLYKLLKKHHLKASLFRAS